MTTTLTAAGMVCDGCAKAVTRALSRVPGVEAVAVAVPEQRVEVTHDGRATLAELNGALAKAGFAPPSA